MDQELAATVGQRVRQLRLRAGNSLRRQAKLVGVSSSALSGLENFRGGMSLAALQRVASHFGLSITDLLAGPSVQGHGAASYDTKESIEVHRSWASTAGSVPRGVGAIHQLLGSGNGHTLQPDLITFLPGGGFDRDAIAHPGEAFTYVLAGEVDLIYGDESHRLRQGDAVRFRTETPHSFRNGSASGIAVIVGATAPPW